MSTASAVPETYELEGEDAKEVLRRAGRGRLAKDSFTRFRTADGFSMTRAVAHAAALTAFPALITIIGLASALNFSGFRRVLEHALQTLAPGPAGQLLREAFGQGSGVGGAALIGGVVGVLISGTFAMAQVERGCNRIYGMARDRGIWRKLGRAFVLNITAGVLFTLAFVVLAAGGAVGDALKGTAGWGDTASLIFSIARWPVGLALAFVALTLVYKLSPNRRQPGAMWLQTGTVVATVLWVAFTALLAWYYSVNDSLGNTYGPLVGIIALLTWAYASAVSIFLGMAFTAQLEAVRAGVPGPRTLRRYNETVVTPEGTGDSPPVVAPVAVPPPAPMQRPDSAATA
jgi:YihY family inner membrane protein